MAQDTSGNKIKKKENKQMYQKELSWLSNPKFILAFDSKDKIPEVEFTVKLARSEIIWNKKISSNIVNSMIGLYIFNFDSGDNWSKRSNQLRADKTEFISKNELEIQFIEKKVDPRGFILMPSTYGPNISGPFTIEVKCKFPYVLKEFTNSS